MPLRCPPSPSAPYGLSKLAIEIMVREFRELHGLDAVVVRPSVTFGPGRFTALSGSFNKLIHDVALGIPTTFPQWPGGLEKGLIQGIFAEDMADTFVRATVAPETEEFVFNAPTTPAYTIPEVVDLLRQHVPDADIEVVDHDYAGLVPFPVVRGERAIETLGSVPRYSLHDAIGWMIGYYRDTGGERAPGRASA